MLVVRKLALTFVVSFAAIFLTGILGILDSITDVGSITTQKDALVSLVLAAIIAGVRAVVMYLTAFVPGDAQHGANLVGAYKKQP